jgi:hypothetical protein
MEGVALSLVLIPVYNTAGRRAERRRERTAGMRLDGMGWDGTGCGMGWDGMGRDGMGWRGGSEAPQSAVDPLRAISFRGALGCPSSRCGIYGGGQAGHTTWPSRPLLGGALFPLVVTQPPHNPKAFIIGKG